VLDTTGAGDQFAAGFLYGMTMARVWRLRPAGGAGGGRSDLALWRAAGNVAEGFAAKAGLL